VVNGQECSLVSEDAIFHSYDPVQVPRTPFIMIYANGMETRIAVKDCLIAAALSVETSKSVSLISNCSRNLGQE
jgi:hypothetical protein